MTSGFLLAIEGVDGSGKRSVSEALAERAVAAGRSASTFAFPNYDTPTGQAIADHLRSHDLDVPPEAAAVLFAADRLQYREKLELALGRGELVIVDRYVASNAAYQAARVPVDDRRRFGEWVERLEYGLMKMPRPSLTLLLDVTLAESRHRTSTRELAAGRPGHDHYEASEDLLRAAIAQYRHFACARDWTVIEASTIALPVVVDRCWEAIDARMGA